MGKRTHGPYLIAAIEYGDIEKVSHILSTKFRDKAKVKLFLVSEVRRLASEYSEIPLLLSATLADPAIIRYFVTKHEANINFVYEYGTQGQRRRKTALLVAVRRGLYVTVDAILQLNGDINFADHKGRTALHHAVRRADYRMAKLLLSRGAQTSPTDLAGNSPLHVAAIFGHTEMCRLLLKHGADVYKKGQHGAVAVHIAAREGHASLVRMFITLYEVNVDLRVPCYDDRELAPLHVAASEGHYETVFTLLESCGADVNLRDSEGETPLHCAVIREYDPLGMKSKDDYTETVKVLLNYGAEVNVRNARGETALHLAARNEFQKVIEVLILAGSDPLIEDNDRNKAIDLVTPEDTVSRQTLKTAMADRERIMSEAREIRSKGFTTSLQRELPLSMRSQSTLNIPMAGMQASLGASRFVSHTGIYQPQMQMFPQHGMTMGSNMSGYMPGMMMAGIPTYPNNQSGSRTSSSTSSSKRRSEFAAGAARLPASMHNTSTGMIQTAGQFADRPLAAMRKTKSVEQLDQPSRGLREADLKSGKKGTRRVRKASYQESETSSFWAVTPPSSVRDESELDPAEVPAAASKKAAAGRAGRAKANTKAKMRLNESDEELENDSAGKKKKKKPQQQTAPMQFVQPGKNFDGNESEEYYLDDDDGASSVDILEVQQPAVKSKKKKAEKPLPALPTKAAAGKKKGETAGGGGKAGLQSWLDEQARILKERNKAAADGPVAHSTPPASKKPGKGKAPVVSSSSSSETSLSDSDSDAPKQPPPPPPGGKPKPLPPPKPGAKPALGTRPLFVMENPRFNQVVQLDVDETQSEAQTIISVIPVNPPGPTRVQKIPHGMSATTHINLQKSFSDDDGLSSNTPSKKAPPPIAKPKKGSAKESVSSVGSFEEAAAAAPKPVPRPRDSKPVPAGRASTSAQSKQPSAQKTNASKKLVEVSSSEESSTDFSDDDLDAPPVVVVPSSKPSTSRSPAATTPTKPQQSAFDRVSPVKPVQAGTQAGKKQPLTTQTSRPGGLVFEKAKIPESVDSGNVSSVTLRSSLGDLTAGPPPAVHPAVPPAAAAVASVSTPSVPAPSVRMRKSSESELLSTSGSGGRPQTLNTSTGSERSATKQQPTEAVKTTSKPQQQQQPTAQMRQPQQKNHSSKEEEQQESSEEDDDDDEEDSDDGGPKPDYSQLKTVTYEADGQSLGFTLVGGNVKGVFVHTIDPRSAAGKRGLTFGHQLLRINNQTLVGKTREEVYQYVHAAVGQVTLTIRSKPNECRAIGDHDGGAGDAFFARAHFSSEVTKKGELAVHEGDVFAITDTMPDGNPGYWKARKLDSGRRSEDAGVGIGSAGLIPNKARADQIVTKLNLAQGKPGPNERGGAFFRSFRRSKSATRAGGRGDQEEEDKRLSAGLDVLSYERVVQKISDSRRPVIILGLFCDTVRTMLIRDVPDRFVAPTDEVETPKDETPVNVRPILSTDQHQHCLLILSPPAIEFLQQKTDLNPISVYISPVSKAVVKVVKSKLAPNYNKNAGFMFEEAARFEKNYAHLFTATVPYSTDDAWFFNLKAIIEQQQNQPMWIGLTPAEVEAACAAEASKILPPVAVTSRTGRAAASTAVRASRTTDDLPHEYKTQESVSSIAGSGAATATVTAGKQRYVKNDVKAGIGVTPSAGTQAPSSARVQSSAAPFSYDAPPAAGVASSAASAGSVAKMAAARNRAQSSSSSLDQSGDRNHHPVAPRTRNQLPPSHETQL